MKKINIILPVYNESESIISFLELLEENIQKLNYEFLVTIVDDGSVDTTWDDIYNFEFKSENLSLLKIKLLKNFGHQAALTCGLENFKGDACILMDADFQDDPKYIKDLIGNWENGSEVVLARRLKRDDGFLKNVLFYLFYKVQYYLSDIKIPKNVGHYSLMNKKVVERINNLPEVNRYINGLRALSSYRHTFISVVKNKRRSGKSKMSLKNLFYLALKGIFDYSTKPIRLIGYLGLLISIGSILFSVIVFLQSQLYGVKVFNWDFGLSSIYFLSGLQLLSLSIIGEYIRSIFTEIKKRPIYIIDQVVD